MNNAQCNAHLGATRGVGGWGWLVSAGLVGRSDSSSASLGERGWLACAGVTPEMWWAVGWGSVMPFRGLI